MFVVKDPYLYVVLLQLNELAYRKLLSCLFTGMLSRDFKGIPSIQEVECWGGKLEAEVKLLSLKMYTTSDNSVLASLNVFANSCITFGAMSSCFIEAADTHKSRLRVLVADLEEGESREFGCKASTVNSLGDPHTTTWSIVVRRKSE